LGIGRLCLEHPTVNLLRLLQGPRAMVALTQGQQLRNRRHTLAPSRWRETADKETGTPAISPCLLSSRHPPPISSARSPCAGKYRTSRRAGSRETGAALDTTGSPRVRA